MDQMAQRFPEGRIAACTCIPMMMMMDDGRTAGTEEANTVPRYDISTVDKIGSCDLALMNDALALRSQGPPFLVFKMDVVK